MAVWKWPAITLKGEGGQVIPRLCPGCLQPATVEFRYGYRGPFFLISRTTYYQTFHYCDACARTVDSFYAWRGSVAFLGIILGFAAFVTIFVGVDELTKSGGPLESMKQSDVLIGVLLVLGFAAAVGVFTGLLWLKERIGRIRNPQPPGQAVWGPAAYYTGTAAAGFSLNSHVYRAFRPEWIKALVEANPEKVDDATYRTWVGADKPAAPAAKPFAS